jgi:integrase
MAFVFKPVVTRKKNGKTVKARTAFFWAEYVNTDGQTKREALKLPNGEGITDRRAAEAALRELLTRTERKAVGLVDLAVENAGLSFRAVVARFVWHLRAQRRTRDYIKLVKNRLKWMGQTAGIERLGQVNEPSITKALAVLSGRKAAPRTINAHRAAFRNLCSWAVTVAKLMDKNPVDAVPTQEIGGDIRKKRRALTHAEAEALLRAAPKRALWYETALHTGLRVSEQAALQWQDLHLEGPRPAIQLRALTTKARRADTVPLRADLAAKLKAARPPFARPTDRVFKTAPKKETFYADCERAGIQYKPDAQGRSVDRHSLRTTFISWLSGADVSPRTAQELARHSELKLTMQTYTDPQVLDTFGAVERLPELRPDNRPETQQKTGTYDDGSVVVGVVPSVVSNMREGHGNATNGEKATEAENDISPCDAMTCACVLNTSIGWEKTGPGRGDRGHWRAIASSGTHGPGRGEPGP